MKDLRRINNVLKISYGCHRQGSHSHLSKMIDFKLFKINFKKSMHKKLNLSILWFLTNGNFYDTSAYIQWFLWEKCGKFVIFAKLACLFLLFLLSISSLSTQLKLQYFRGKSYISFTSISVYFSPNKPNFHVT